ncbi:MAG: glycosyltransferase [Kiritimatiellia bacterium]
MSLSAFYDLPDVSVVIPYHNCPELTAACLQSFAEHSRDLNWELILVDDASTEQPDVDWIRDHPRVQRIRNESRKSYSENNNAAAARARGRYLCLLNNDTLLTPGWGSALLAVAERHPDLGVLGNLHLYPDSGKVQHSGMGFDAADKPFHLNPGSDPASAAVRYERAFQCVTFACVLIPKTVYEELGGLDESYRNGFEDCDFCLRARARGKQVLYTPASRIYHYGQSTPGRTANDDRNWLRFQEIWGGKVEPDLKSLGEEDQRINKASVQASAGNRPGLHLSVDLSVANAFTWATVDLIEALNRRGVPMSIPQQPVIDASIPEKHRGLLKSLMSITPRSTYHVKWTHYWPHHYREPLFGEVNAEFFCTNYRYNAEKVFPDLWMRHVVVNEYRKIPVAEYNLEALTELGVSAEQCRVMPLGYSPEIEEVFPAGTPEPERGAGPLKILLVTNSHDLYRYGTDLAVQALSRAFSAEEDVVVHIKDYGASSGSTVLQEWISACDRFPRIEWHRTFLSKEDLLRLYAGMDLQLAPFRGEGFSMKILDAAALGVPTMMPAYGGPMTFSTPDTFLSLPFREVPVGDCYDQRNTYLGEGATWAEAELEPMVEMLRSCLQNPAQCREVGEAARKHVRPAFSWDAAAATFMNTLEGWYTERETALSVQRKPHTLPLTVIIPTKDREDILSKTLDAYQAQTLEASAFEILIVNDHGDLPALKELLDRYPGLNTRLIDNQGPGGPAAARNLAIRNCTAEIVLITGDDIVPVKNFLRQHMEGHRRHPEPESAFVGFTDWHEDLPQTPFMNHITGKGGQQFKYDDMRDDKVVPFDRLYTSNCSLKRRFLLEEEVLFSTRYRYAAYEDVELGYRLHLKGMKLRFLSKALGYHLHEMTPGSFLERQRKVGRMLTLLTLQRPSYVPNEHAAFLRALEFYRAKPALHQHSFSGVNPENLIEELSRCCQEMMSLNLGLAGETGLPLVDQDGAVWADWFARGTGQVWESLNQMILRAGMAEEWAGDAEDKAASTWIQLVLLPNVLGCAGMSWEMPFSRPDYTTLVAPNSKLIYNLAKFCRNAPVLGSMVQRFEHSAHGRTVRLYLAKWLAR